MTTVGHVAGWIPMPAPLLAAALEELGLEEASYVRHLANIDEADLMAARGTIKVGERPLTPAAKGMVVLLWRVGRLAAGAEKSAEAKQLEAQAARDAAAALEREKLQVMREQLAATKDKTQRRRPHRRLCRPATWPGYGAKRCPARPS